MYLMYLIPDNLHKFYITVMAFRGTKMEKVSAGSWAGLAALKKKLGFLKDLRLTIKQRWSAELVRV